MISFTAFPAINYKDVIIFDKIGWLEENFDLAIWFGFPIFFTIIINKTLFNVDIHFAYLKFARYL